jgi:hypothetical protein
VEYGTGVVVSDDGAIVADRQITDGCLAVAIAGFGNADRVGEDRDHDLALLRIYGAHGLKPLNLANGAVKTALDLTGISDPQNQGGAAAVSSVKASVAQLDGGSDAALSPAPALGFSGAAALDSDGRFAGIALLKPVLAAGPPNTTPAAQAVLVTANAVRDFLQANGVNTANGSADAKASDAKASDAKAGDPKPSDPKASIVRVICVRK